MVDANKQLERIGIPKFLSNIRKISNVSGSVFQLCG